MARKPRPWFRFYVEAVHDRKLRRLKPEQRWLFVACLAAARQSVVPGVLLVSDREPMTNDDLADFAGMTLRATEVGMSALILAGVIVVDRWTPEMHKEAFIVPAWGERQYESDNSTARVEKHRTLQRSNDVSETADVTPPETETEVREQNPPNPPATKVDQIMDGVFAKELQAKQAAGDQIRSVDGWRKWWMTEGNGPDLRRRAEWMFEHYEMTLSQYVDAVRSVTTPQWAASMRRETA